jgi:hypothetical protein
LNPSAFEEVGMDNEVGTLRVKTGLAEMLKGGVIMDVTTAEQAKIAEDAGACAVRPSSACPPTSAGMAAWPAWRPDQGRGDRRRSSRSP